MKTRPVRPSLTNSVIAPSREAITGVPREKASMMVRPKVSYQTDGITRHVASPMIESTCSGVCPLSIYMDHSTMVGELLAMGPPDLPDEDPEAEFLALVERVASWSRARSLQLKPAAPAPARIVEVLEAQSGNRPAGEDKRRAKGRAYGTPNRWAHGRARLPPSRIAAH